MILLNSRALLARSIDYKKNGSTRYLLLTVLHAMRSMVHRHKLSQLQSVPFLKWSPFAGTCRAPIFSRERTMHPRFRVIETTGMEDGAKRYRVVDLVEGGSASKHGVFKIRTDAEAVCSLLNAEPHQRDVTHKSLSL